MKNTIEEQIFKNGSTTYYFSSKFFPKSVREDIFKLYSFVRVADDYVDAVPAQSRDFHALRQLWKEAFTRGSIAKRSSEDTINERIVKNIVFICHKYNFDRQWVESFFNSMQADLDKKLYQSLEQTLEYVNGSAEVIGLMMAKIMTLPDDAFYYASLQGRAMQFINFIRDIDEDNRLGRCYFPNEELRHFHLKNLTDPRQSVEGDPSNPDNFIEFIHFQLNRYKTWQEEATLGYSYIPLRMRIPLETAVEMYDWTAQLIYQNPFVIFDRKVKPTKRQVLRAAGSKMLLQKN